MVVKFSWTGEAVVARLVNEFEQVGLRVVLEKAPDLAEEEYEGGTFVRHDGGMVSVFVTKRANVELS